jgi:hypothetical protein
MKLFCTRLSLNRQRLHKFLHSGAKANLLKHSESDLVHSNLASKSQEIFIKTICVFKLFCLTIVQLSFDITILEKKSGKLKKPYPYQPPTPLFESKESIPS